ncbi:tyrosine-type recombinase/integrase [Maribellus maritimus]|uniref:tyrosine-type recombinase/integrase n=1 Tax=Maribellus maritimus TaxID=2870838 RepID=UPI001EEA3466|nr:tyrosine-type recombinase/integrase [Maribellus maritimus]MCG6189120.1 tyrosine-type recombinase/integrase [Maribellus maritimus]
MSKKFSTTTADHLEWNQSMNLIRNLYDDGNYKISLLIAIGSFWGLRISDILKLRWEQVYNLDEIIIVEQKTGKTREIKINQQLKQHITNCYEKIKPRTNDEFIFTSQKGSVYSIQRINVILKEIKAKYNLKIKNFSSHSLRKCFGREIFNRSGSNAELALVKLSHLFNHSNPSITRRYLGIAKEELMQTYDVLSF